MTEHCVLFPYRYRRVSVSLLSALREQWWSRIQLRWWMVDEEWLWKWWCWDQLLVAPDR